MATFDLVARWAFVWILCGFATIPVWWLVNRDVFRYVDSSVYIGWAAFNVLAWPAFWASLVIDGCAWVSRAVHNTYLCAKAARIGPTDMALWTAGWRFHPKRMRAFARLFNQPTPSPPTPEAE